LLAYSEDGSRRRGVACLVRAMAGRGWLLACGRREGGERKENLDDSPRERSSSAKREPESGEASPRQTTKNRAANNREGKQCQKWTKRGWAVFALCVCLSVSRRWWDLTCALLHR
jgi:hypothetical protein